MRAVFKKVIVTLLTLEAGMIVRRHKPHIIAVTGSVGKTSTKDAIYEVVAQGAYVRKSQKSFNSEIGLPLTILGRPNGWNNPLQWLLNLIDGLFIMIGSARYPEWLVLEVGADRPGDIKKVARWLPVDIAVITRLPEVPVHVEFFESAAQVAEEKAALIDALRPDGTLVLYADDARTAEFTKRYLSNPDAFGSGLRPERRRKIITFGFAPEADVRAEDMSLLFEGGSEQWPIGMSARIVVGGVSAPIQVLGTLGAHTLLPALAAAAVGATLGKPVSDISLALKAYEPPQGRMHLVRGIKSTLIIDDTYNSSPAAVTAALDTLKMIGGATLGGGITQGRLIAVLGDMLELGRLSVEEHRKIGMYLTELKIDMLVTVGFRARDIAEGAQVGGMAESSILQFEDAQKAGEELAALVQSGDCILVKGSQSMRMERTVKELMQNPERASDILVRQDEEWIKKR